MAQNCTLKNLFALALDQIDSAEIKQLVEQIEQGTDSILLPELLLVEEEEEEQAENTNLAALIRDMTIPERIKLALRGNHTARTLLVRNSNRQIPLFVLQNPRITDNEVCEYAKNSNLDESVLRAISKETNWVKHYPVKQALVSNAKTPLDVSLKWLKHLKTRDIRRLSNSKDIPQVIAQQARKTLDKRDKRS